MGIKAPKNDFRINPNLDLFSSNSRDPSKTIRTSPKVPSIGKTSEKSGRWKLKREVTCLTAHPKSNSKITDGTLVRDDVISNKYDIRSNEQIAIIMVNVIIC